MRRDESGLSERKPSTPKINGLTTSVVGGPVEFHANIHVRSELFSQGCEVFHRLLHEPGAFHVTVGLSALGVVGFC